MIDQQALVTRDPASLGFSVAVTGNISQGTNIFNDLRFVQTITSGARGLLTEIDIQGVRATSSFSGVLQFSLIDGDYAAGARTVVGIQSYPFGALPLGAPTSLVSFDTSSFHYRVQPGQVFSLVGQVYTPSANEFFIAALGNYYGMGSNGTPINISTGYAGGSFYRFRGANPSGLLNTGLDVGLRTWVAAVPEPANWAMMIMGFGMVGGVMRRRRVAAY